MAPFSPTIAAIRYGYGLAPDQVLSKNQDDLLVQLADARLAPTFFPFGGVDTGQQRADALAAGFQVLRDLKNDEEKKREVRKRLQQTVDQSFQRDGVARVMQAVFSPYGFHERLAAFWFDHFSVNAQKKLEMKLITPLYEEQAIRPNLAGHFRDLLHAAVLHPAMLIYLDQDASAGPQSDMALKRKRGLNENLGRELLELHTLGAGSGYTQRDVRSAAMVLTGMSVDERYERTFKPAMAQPGEIKVLNASYGGDKRSADDCMTMLDDLARRPETAQHICIKLVRHFIADQPPPEVVSAMKQAWKASDGNLTRVYAAMLNHPRAWSDPGMKIKLPFDFVVSGLRAFGITAKNWKDRLSPGIDGDVANLMIPPVQAVRDIAQAALDEKAAPDAKASAAGASASAGVASGSMDMKAGMDMKGGMAPAGPGGAMGSTGSTGSMGDAAMMGSAMSPAGDKKPGDQKTASGGAAQKPQDPNKPGLARSLTFNTLKRMGQPVWQPPSPAGFEEGVASWLSPSQLSERILWARRAAASLSAEIDPKSFLRAALSDQARADTITVVQRAPNRQSGVALALASPEFNRR